ncbi:uncharacterized protein ACOB8E_023643 [Sarcophilus harrisii]
MGSKRNTFREDISISNEALKSQRLSGPSLTPISESGCFDHPAPGISSAPRPPTSLFPLSPQATPSRAPLQQLLLRPLLSPACGPARGAPPPSELRVPRRSAHLLTGRLRLQLRRPPRAHSVLPDISQPPLPRIFPPPPFPIHFQSNKPPRLTRGGKAGGRGQPPALAQPSPALPGPVARLASAAPRAHSAPHWGLDAAAAAAAAARQWGTGEGSGEGGVSRAPPPSQRPAGGGHRRGGGSAGASTTAPQPLRLMEEEKKEEEEEEAGCLSVWLAAAPGAAAFSLPLAPLPTFPLPLSKVKGNRLAANPSELETTLLLSHTAHSHEWGIQGMDFFLSWPFAKGENCG